MTQPSDSAPFLPAASVPLSFGQILDRIYRLVRSQFRLFASIAAVPAAAVFIVIAAVAGCAFAAMGPQMAGNPTPPQPSTLVLPVILILLAELIFPFIYALYLPAASYAAIQADLGIPVTFSQSYAVAARRFLRYLWLMVLLCLYVMVPVLVVAVLIGLGTLLLHLQPGAAASPTAFFFLVPLVLLFYLGILVYTVLIMLRFAVAFPASVAEDLPAWASLGRSARLTRGSRGSIFLVLLVVYAVAYLINLVCIAAFMLVATFVGVIAYAAHVAAPSAAFYVLIGLGALAYMLVLIACAMITYSAYSAALAVVYHNQRLRIDGPPPAPALAAGPA